MADKTPRFGQVATAMVTPFDNDLRVNERQVKHLCDYLISHGTDTLVVCGTTGESPTLSHNEKIRMIHLVREAAGTRAQVIAGTGTNNTSDTVLLTKEAAQIGVDGVLLVGPYYNKPSQQGMYEHFRTAAESIDLPVMLYNVPARSSVNIASSTVARLAADCSNIVAIKEASGDMAQVGEIVASTPDDFEIYSGADEVNLPVLALGG